MNRLKYIFLSFFIVAIWGSVRGGHLEISLNTMNGRGFSPPPGYSTPWVDSVYNSLSLEQRIGQLLMIEVSSNQNTRYYNRIENLIQKYNIGGVAFFRGGPVSQLNLTNTWQQKARVPLLVAMDAEWGLAMRLDSTVAFPRNITLGAIANERLIYELGLEMGWQCKRMGVHMNFAPIVDVNSNPANPVINSRSFGECRYNVTRKGMALMFGMQDAGIIATAKHFPGHGDTDTDSHYTLPVIQHPLQEIDSIHLFPFRNLVDQGLYAVMMAHLQIPALDSHQSLPSSLSENIVSGLLQKQMGFEGLIVTDALNMKGVSDTYNSGELELRALQAGNDLLLMPENVPLAVETIKKAIESGEFSPDYLEHKVKKILYFKELAGLDQSRRIPVQNLYNDLNATRVHNLNRRLAEAAITLIHNQNDLLPLKNLDTLKIAALSIGASADNPFQATMGNYTAMDLFSIPKNHNDRQARNILQQLKPYNLVVVSVQNNSMFPGRNYGINQATIDLVNAVSKQTNTIVNVFANPYSLASFGDDLLNAQAIMVSYQDGRQFEQAAAQVIFGAIPARGRLPVSVLPHFSIYTGINTSGRLRIRHLPPEDTGVSSQKLQRIDSIVEHAMQQKAFPGCQIAVIKDGAMIYQKSFGYHTYDKRSRVRNSDIYDLASLTKIAATTLSVMKLADDGLLDINQPISRYLPWLKGSNKENLVIRDILAHQARLRSWIPFFLQTLNEGKPHPDIFSKTMTPEFPVQVADHMFIHRNYRDTIFQTLIDSDLLPRRRYLYSDLGFILLAEVVQQLTGRSIDTYTHEEFFNPLGLQTIGFNPLLRFETSRIAPTEHDTLFRRQLIWGHVHDPGAAMLGGVSGHAGLFSNAADVAVIMQMLMNNGSYGGQAFIQAETIKEFTTTQFAGNQNRRALGFDKPLIRPGNNNPAAQSASDLSYGHSGFTGTFAWADPAENLVYVFLSNRVHPDAANRKITQLQVRTGIHQAIYDAIYYHRYIQTTRLP